MVHAGRRQPRGRARILYWFRTPPGIRVGRAALDEETIALIEQSHPTIRFDWRQILRGEEEAPESPPMRGEREPRADRDRVPPEVLPAAPVTDASVVSGPAFAQLGAEGVTRLRNRYAELIAGIGRRIPDPARQQQMTQEAARLNPDNWSTPDEVRLALEQYEAVLESLRGLLGRRRRRRKSRPAGGGAGESAGAIEQASAPDGAQSADHDSSDTDPQDPDDDLESDPGTHG